MKNDLNTLDSVRKMDIGMEVRERKISNIIDVESFHDELITEIDEVKKELPNYRKYLIDYWTFVSK